MYEEMTFENIQQEMLDRVSDELDKREGGMIWDAAAPVAYRLSEMYFQLGNYPDLIFPDTSAGEYLERFAAAFGVERKTSAEAEESDEALRDRLLKKMRQPAAGGNAHDYYNWAMACPGVGAARVFPLAEGPGTVKVVLAGGDMRAASPELAGEAAEYIEERRPIGADVRVVPAAERTVSVTAAVRLAAGRNLGAVQTAFQEVFDVFLRESIFKRDYISLARVGNLLLEQNGVEDYSDLLLNGAAENLEILPGEIAVTGTVRLEA